MILHIARTGKNVTLDMISSKIERERERKSMKESVKENERERVNVVKLANLHTMKVRLGTGEF